MTNKLKKLIMNGTEFNIPDFTAGENIDITSDVISATNAYIINASDVTVTTDSTKGVAPYNTSYGYTDFTINANAGIKWVEGAIYIFNMNADNVVSANRNSRVRIGTGAYIPVMDAAGNIADGRYSMNKAYNRIFIYKTTYQSGGALHYNTDTSYGAITVANITGGTSTTAKTVSGSIFNQGVAALAILKSNNGGQTITNTDSSNTTPLSLTSSNSSSYIAFNGSGGYLGSFGVTSSKSPQFYNGTSHTLAYTSDVLTKTNTTEFTPTGDYQPATKKYVDDNAGTDYSRQTKTISSGSVEIGLRTIVEPTANFTLTAPSTLKDGEEYVIRCVNKTAYTITLGTGFTNPRDVSLSLSTYATDQFVFIAVGGTLELQPLITIS